MANSNSYRPEEEFTGRLRARLPMNVLFTLTAEQLQALRTAFGTRFQNQHSLDLRGRLYLPWSRYYVVFQLGRDRRTDTRRSPLQVRIRTVIDSLGFGVILAGLAGLGWLAAYTL